MGASPRFLTTFALSTPYERYGYSVPARSIPGVDSWLIGRSLGSAISVTGITILLAYPIKYL